MLNIKDSTPPIIAKTLAVGGLAASVLLGASPANALDFTFSFQDTAGTNGLITGTLSGLVEGDNPGPGITATVLSSPGGDLLGSYNAFSSVFPNPPVFTVTGGNITFAQAEFSNTSIPNYRLFLVTSSANQTRLTDTLTLVTYLDTANITISFAPATAVPFELNSTVGLATLGLCFGAAKLRRNHLAKKRMISVS